MKSNCPLSWIWKKVLCNTYMTPQITFKVKGLRENINFLTMRQWIGNSFEEIANWKKKYQKVKIWLNMASTIGLRWQQFIPSTKIITKSCSPITFSKVAKLGRYCLNSKKVLEGWSQRAGTFRPHPHPMWVYQWSNVWNATDYVGCTPRKYFRTFTVLTCTSTAYQTLWKHV